jgi:DNA primase
MDILSSKPDIVSVLQKEGILLKKRGKYLWALCPLHTEKTPSFKVDPVKQTFYCFGCNAHGDSIAFIQAYKSLSFKESLSYLNLENSVTPLTRRELKKRGAVKGFREWCKDYYDDLCTKYRVLNRAKLLVRTERDLERLIPYYHQEPTWEYYMDVLTSEDDEAKFQLYRSKVYGR